MAPFPKPNFFKTNFFTNNFPQPNKGRIPKKNGLFNDIDHISFNTHPPPPKNDMWQKWLSVGNFTTHPPKRNDDIFLKKRGFWEDISAIKFQVYFRIFFITLPLFEINLWGEGLKNKRVWPSYKLLPTWSSEGVEYNP